MLELHFKHQIFMLLNVYQNTIKALAKSKYIKCFYTAQCPMTDRERMFKNFISPFKKKHLKIVHHSYIEDSPEITIDRKYI